MADLLLGTSTVAGFVLPQLLDSPTPRPPKWRLPGRHIRPVAGPRVPRESSSSEQRSLETSDGRSADDRFHARPVALGTAQGRWLFAVTVLASGSIVTPPPSGGAPVIVRDLTPSRAAVTISGYTPDGGPPLILLGSRLGPLRTAPRPLVGALFRRASLVCGLAQSPGQLVAARVCRGSRRAAHPGSWPSSIPRSGADRAKAIGCGRHWGNRRMIGPFPGRAPGRPRQRRGLSCSTCRWRTHLAVAGRHVTEAWRRAHVASTSGGALACGAGAPPTADRGR